MTSIVYRLNKQQLMTPPEFVTSQTQYEVMMGSVAYGVSTDMSDVDVYGWCIPKKETIFPHLAGEINGFGRQKKRFDQWQQHHILEPSSKREYDLQIYNIVKYFQLCMENNPNMIDSLFVPQRCVLHCTRVGDMVRENRKLFLHKGSWYKYKGYAFSQVNKMKSKAIKEFVAFCDMWKLPYNIALDEGVKSLEGKMHMPQENVKIFKRLAGQVGSPDKRTKRVETISKHGYDLKFAYHTVRLLNQVEQIMTECDLDLERNREQLKAIRRGEWTIEQVEKYFDQKERDLEGLYTSSKLQHSPDESAIKTLLLNCLEEHFGTLEKCVSLPNKTEQLVQDLEMLVNKYKKG